MPQRIAELIAIKRYFRCHPDPVYARSQDRSTDVPVMFQMAPQRGSAPWAHPTQRTDFDTRFFMHISTAIWGKPSGKKSTKFSTGCFVILIYRKLYVANALKTIISHRYDHGYFPPHTDQAPPPMHGGISSGHPPPAPLWPLPYGIRASP